MAPWNRTPVQCPRCIGSSLRRAARPRYAQGWFRLGAWAKRVAWVLLLATPGLWLLGDTRVAERGLMARAGAESLTAVVRDFQRVHRRLPARLAELAVPDVAHGGAPWVETAGDGGPRDPFGDFQLVAFDDGCFHVTYDDPREAWALERSLWLTVVATLLVGGVLLSWRQRHWRCDRCGWLEDSEGAPAPFAMAIDAR